jgi:hypothetical protein
MGSDLSMVLKSGFLVRLACVAGVAASLGACASAERLQGTGIGSRPFGEARAAPGPQPDLPAAPPITSAPVDTQPLAPPPGAAAAPPPADAVPTTPPPAPRAIEPPVMPGGPREIATLGGQPSGAAGGGRGPVTSRDGVIGGWTARETNGATCRVQLSSTPALDLYRANASGCANRDLGRVTAWDYRDGEVYLYQPGGTVAARLRVSDGSSLIGVLSRSGAGLSMGR